MLKKLGMGLVLLFIGTGSVDANGIRNLHNISEEEPLFLAQKKDENNSQYNPVYIDKTGRVILEVSPDRIASPFSEGLAAFSNGLDGDKRKWGFINIKGELVIPYLFENIIYSFSDGLCPVVVNDKFGAIDKTGKLVVPAEFDYIFGFQEGLAHTQENGKSGYIDKIGKWVIPPTLTHTAGFSEGLARAQKDEKGHYGFIDKKGKWVIQAEYDMAVEFHEGLAKIKKGGLSGYINKDGSVFIKPQFQSAGSFSGGVAIIEKEDIYHILKKDKTMIPLPKYRSVSEFSGGMAVAYSKDPQCKKYKERYSHCDIDYIDKDGKIVFTVNAWIARPFKKGLAKIQFRKEDIARYIDKNGRYVWGAPE